MNFWQHLTSILGSFRRTFLTRLPRAPSAIANLEARSRENPAGCQDYAPSNEFCDGDDSRAQHSSPRTVKPDGDISAPCYPDITVASEWTPRTPVSTSSTVNCSGRTVDRCRVGMAANQCQSPSSVEVGPGLPHLKRKDEMKGWEGSTKPGRSVRAKRSEIWIDFFAEGSRRSPEVVSWSSSDRTRGKKRKEKGEVDFDSAISRHVKAREANDCGDLGSVESPQVAIGSYTTHVHRKSCREDSAISDRNVRARVLQNDEECLVGTSRQPRQPVCEAFTTGAHKKRHHSESKNTHRGMSISPVRSVKARSCNDFNSFDLGLTAQSPNTDPTLSAAHVHRKRTLDGSWGNPDTSTPCVRVRFFGHYQNGSAGASQQSPEVAPDPFFPDT